MAQTILIVNDGGKGIDLAPTVAELGYAIDSVANGRETLHRLGEDGLVDLVLMRLDGETARSLETVVEVTAEHPNLPVVVLSGDDDDRTVARAIKAGASDYIVLPAGPERLRIAILNALKLHALSGQVSRLHRRYEGEMGARDLVGESAQMRRVMDLANRAATSNISILIEGESGVGKEMVARAIQGTSERAGKAFVAVNCGAIPENLVESILFGHERGAFTDANARHIGKFQEADGGTLFLDEIGELKPDIQVKLLRALQEGEIDLVGGSKPIAVDIRLISATNRNLAERVSEGGFREDLYYRLNVFPIQVPPLRERLDDIAPLVDHFLAVFASSEHKDVHGIDERAMALLRDFDWPGNVRQLENMIYRAIVLTDGNHLTVDDFPQLVQTAAPESLAGATRQAAAATAYDPVLSAERISGETVAALDTGGQIRTLDEIKAEVIALALDHYRGQMSEVARRLGIGRSTLYRKVREYGIEVAPRGPDAET